MTSSLAALPALDELRDHLASLWGVPAGQTNRIEITSRESNTYGSTFPTEIVSAVVDGHPRERVFFKYEGGRKERSDGHRRGIDHELAVYRRILGPLGMTAPTLQGGYAAGNGADNFWIALEYLDGAVQLQQAWEPEAMPAASAWIGEFHTRAQPLLGLSGLPFLPRYDTSYILQWPEAIARYAQAGEFGWLRDVFARLARWAHLLCADTTVIHGEYYPVNVVFRAGTIYPVDWQSTAVAAGEIDLAILTSGKWEPSVVSECEQAYCAARWPGGAPKTFPKRLAVARLYWLTRLIGEDPARLHQPAFGQCLKEIQAANESLESLE